MQNLTLAQLCDPEAVREIVSSHPVANCALDASDRVLELARVTAEYADPEGPAVVVYTPGRIEILGKHTDYAGGSSLTCAVNHSFFFVAARTDEPGVRVRDSILDNSVFLEFANPFKSADASWLRYPASVIDRFVQNFGRPDHGVAMSFSNTIPRASGISSSSAFVVGIYLAVAALSRVQGFRSYISNLQQPEDLAAYLGSVENGYNFKDLVGKRGVGTKGGAQDHTAILYSKRGMFGHYGYHPLQRRDTVAMPKGTSFVIGSSGVRSRKASSELGLYNHAVEVAKAGLDEWNRAMRTEFPTLGMLVSSSSFSLEKLREILETRTDQDGGSIDEPAISHQKIYDRVSQFAAETTEIIPGAIQALRTGDLKGFGDAVDRSQELSDRLLGNQVGETRFLARSARDIGAIASSAFGAGFGGSVWALVPTGKSHTFMKTWVAAYGSQYPHRIRDARFFIDATGPGAFVLGASARDLLLEPQL